MHTQVTRRANAELCITYYHKRVTTMRAESWTTLDRGGFVTWRESGERSPSRDESASNRIVVERVACLLVRFRRCAATNVNYRNRPTSATECDACLNSSASHPRPQADEKSERKETLRNRIRRLSVFLRLSRPASGVYISVLVKLARRGARAIYVPTRGSRVYLCLRSFVSFGFGGAWCRAWKKLPLLYIAL